MKEKFLIHVIVGVIIFFIGIVIVFSIFNPTTQTKAKAIERFTVVSTSTGQYGIIHIIKDNKTGIEYLWTSSNGRIIKLEK